MEKRFEFLSNLTLAVAATLAAILFWEQAKGVVIFLVTLGVLVAIHEWGHFIAAKSAGVRVYEFALGWGPKLLTYMRRGGTEYTVRALPIGGFVHLKGMQPEEPITPDGLNGRRPAERALVYLAGPLMNVILGVVVLMLTGWLFGVPDEGQVLVGDVLRKSEASRMRVLRVNGAPPPAGYPAGLRVGDRVLAVNGEPVERLDDVARQIHPMAGRPILLRVQRRQDTVELVGVAQPRTVRRPFVVVIDVPEGTRLAVRPGDQLDRIDGQLFGSRREPPDLAAERLLREKAGQPVTLTVWRNGRTRLEIQGIAGPLDLAIRPGERTIGALGFTPLPGQGPRVSLARSVALGWDYLRNFVASLAMMFSRPQVLKDSVGGPIAILAILREAAHLPVLNYVSVLASLSLSLAIFNLLPVFLLDGGHLLVLAVEVLRRRRLEPEMQRKLQLVGIAVIGVLFVLIMSKDIARYFG